MTFVEVEKACKRYLMGEVTIRAIEEMSFFVKRGEFAVVVGPSGSGKTTVLNMLGGMDTIDDGTITIDGNVISGYNNRQRIEYRRREIGFVFQFYNLIQNLTALENVELASQLTGSGLDAAEILGLVGLSDRIKNFPSQLSGGEQQRVAIARALAKNPKLLLCDEPTGALDYATGKRILKLLQQTCRSRHMTVILVTHNAAITPMADRVIKIKNGAVDHIQVNQTPLAVDEIEW